MDSDEFDYKDILKLIEAHEDWRDKTINLIPSENITSPLVRKALTSDFGHRYSAWEEEWGVEGAPNFYLGTKYIDEVYRLGVEAAKYLFKAGYADLRLVSGHITDLALLMSFTEAGDTIAVVSERDGGYPGLQSHTLPRKVCVNTIEIPFDRVEGNIDVDRLENLVRIHRVDAIFIGSSYIPFKHPFRELSELCVRYGITFLYDASHVLGLIAGGVYPNPLEYNVIAYGGSTHKTFPGPQGGIILAIDEVGEDIRRNIMMHVVDNPHYNRIAALTIALYEMIKFGRDYASQIVRNSRRLAEELYNIGIPIKYSDKGFTETHQIILDLNKFNDYIKFAQRLESIGVIVDYGGRLGTQEITRRGLKEGDMETIAEIFKLVYKEKDLNRAREYVNDMVSKYRIEYCFRE